jgi:hypothetical protein
MKIKVRVRAKRYYLGRLRRIKCGIRLWFAIVNSSTIIKMKINRMTTFALFQITKRKGLIEDNFWTKNTDKCAENWGNYYSKMRANLVRS